jgi:hypothetical protein
MNSIRVVAPPTEVTAIPAWQHSTQTTPFQYTPTYDSLRNFWSLIHSTVTFPASLLTQIPCGFNYNSLTYKSQQADFSQQIQQIKKCPLVMLGKVAGATVPKDYDMKVQRQHEGKVPCVLHLDTRRRCLVSFAWRTVGALRRKIQTTIATRLPSPNKTAD